MLKDRDRFSFSGAVICGSGPLFWHVNTHNFMCSDIVFHWGDSGACRRFCLHQHHYVFVALARKILGSRSENCPGVVCFLNFRGWVTDQRGSVITLSSVPVQNGAIPVFLGEGERLLNSLLCGEPLLRSCTVGLRSRHNVWCVFCVFSAPEEWNRTNVSALASALWR